MKPTEIELLSLLRSLLNECLLHNSDYHHRTTTELLDRTSQTIDKLEKSIS